MTNIKNSTLVLTGTVCYPCLKEPNRFSGVHEFLLLFPKDDPDNYEKDIRSRVAKLQGPDYYDGLEFPPVKSGDDLADGRMKAEKKKPDFKAGDEKQFEDFRKFRYVKIKQSKNPKFPWKFVNKEGNLIDQEIVDFGDTVKVAVDIGAKTILGNDCVFINPKIIQLIEQAPGHGISEADALSALGIDPQALAEGIPQEVTVGDPDSDDPW